MTASDISVRGATAPLAATFAVQTMAAMVLFGVTVIAPAAAPDIGVEATLIGTFTSIAYGFGMLAGLLTSAVTDRYGAIRICQGTMVFAFIGVAVLTLYADGSGSECRTSRSVVWPSKSGKHTHPCPGLA